MVKMSIGTGVDSSAAKAKRVRSGPSKDTPPVVITAPALSGAGRIGLAMAASLGVWGGSPAPGLSARWQRNGADIPGATGARYTPVPADDMADLRCVVTASNRAGTVAAATVPARITHAPPVVAGGLADRSFDLASGMREIETAGGFAGAALTFSVTGAGAGVDPATGLVSIPVSAALDAASVTVTASNSGGSAAITFGVTVALAGSAPSVLSAPVLSGTGRIGSPVSVAEGGWGGVPAPTLALRWQRNGADIPGAAGASYTPVPADDAADLRCVVTASNSFGTTSAETGTVKVAYAAPVAAGNLFEEIFDQDGGFQTVDAAPDFTVAGDPGLGGVSWSVSGAGATIDGAGMVSVPTAAPVSAEAVTVTATNSGGSAESVFLVTVEGDTGAVPFDVALSPSIAVPGTHITATPVHADGSGPTGNETFQWFEGGVEISGATWETYVARSSHVSALDLTVRITDPDRGDVMSRAATVIDGPAYSGAGAATGNASRLSQYNALPLTGGTVWLAPGAVFTDWVPPSRLFTGPCVFRSVDPSNPAIFRGLRINNKCTNIIVRDVIQEFVPTTTSLATTFLNTVYGASERITYLDCEMYGGLNVNPGLNIYIGYNVGRMVTVGAGVKDVAFIGCEFHTMSGGVFAISSETDRLTVEGCESHGMSGDAYQFWTVDGIRFVNNVVRDALANQTTPFADHVDGLQFANAAGSRGNSNAWIEGNIMHSGDASNSWFQSFFLSAETSLEPRRHKNVTLINNLAYNAHKWGFRLTSCDGGLIKNNTCIRNWDQTNSSPDIEIWVQNCTDVVVEKNVAQNINIDNGNTDVRSVDNYIYTPAAEGSQAEFIGGLIGGSTMAQLQPVPGGAILVGGYGATYSSAPLNGGAVEPDTPVTLDELPFDRFVFNAADNANAVVTLKGGGTPGSIVQIRGESGGGNTAWSAGSTVDGAGEWAATLSVPLAQWADWYTPAARYDGDDASKVTGTNEFGCGHVVVAMAQSEAEYWINHLSTYSGANMPVPTGTVDENAVFVLQSTAASGAIQTFHHDTYAYSNGNTIGKAGMFLAKMLSEGTPGRKWCIVDGAVPGTGRIDLFSDLDNDDDTSNNRSWANFEATVDVATGGSRRAGENLTEVGHLLDAAWFTNDAGTIKTSWDRYIPGYFGQNVAGASFPLGTNTRDGNRIDHCLWDLTGANRGLFSTNTKWSITPPNNYADYLEDLRNSIHTVSGGLVRAGYEDILANTKALHGEARVDSIRGVFGVSPHVYRTGFWNGSSWTDSIHPDRDSAYGTPYLAMHMGVSMMMAAGIGYQSPEITDVTVAAGGATAVVRVSLPNGGTLTTGRIKRGLADPTPNPAHRQPAHGFEILRAGDPLADLTPFGFTAAITNTGTGSGAGRYGEVTITPTLAFATGDTLHYARGGAYGLLDYQAENAALLQLDFLVENVPALTEYDGIPVGARVKDLGLTGAAVRGFSPAWYSATGQVVNTAYGTNFDDVANSGIRKATFITTYAPGATDGDGVSTTIFYGYKHLDFYMRSDGVMRCRNLANNQIPLGFPMSNIGAPAVWRARDYAIVIVYDTTQAAAEDRVKGVVVDLTTGAEYAMDTNAGAVPALNADVEAFANAGIGNCYGAKTAGFVQQSSGAFERVQAWVDVAADLADLSGLHVGGALKDPARAGTIAAAGGGTLSAGQLVVDIHGANLPAGVNLGAGPDFPKAGAGNWVVR